MRAKARKSCPNCLRLQAKLDAQEARLEAIEATVVRLQEQLAAARKDSSTSSKPPSSDIVKPPKPPPPEGQDKRRIGGQPGHPKHERAAFSPESVNAGVDMFMVPFDFRAFVANTVADVDAGLIPISRIDDAVTRILRTKLRGGLFHLPKPSERQFANDQDAITDRSLARRAVRESLVLLKNNDNVLPLPRDVKVLLVGKSGDSIQNQTGGWSRTWQGGPAPFAPDDVNLNSDFPSGQSILGALRETVGEDHVTFSADASGVNVADFDVAIAAVGELPYAEFFGDVATADGNWRDPTNLAKRTLEHGVRYPEDRAVLEAVSGQGVPVVTVLMSGRVLYTNREINLSDAFVAAWLPGTEAGGITDVLFRSSSGPRRDFSGKLPFSWPRSACQTTVNIGDEDYDPQFPLGYGLTDGDDENLGVLDETPGPAEGCAK